MAILKTAAINVPRIGYNPADDTLRGLLIEEQRTNVLLHNRNLDIVPWSGANLAAIAQNEFGLHGMANTAWTITDNDDAATQNRTQDVTIPNDSNQHVVSMYIKKTASTQYGGFLLSLLGGTTEVTAGAYLRPSDGAKSATGAGITLHEVHDAGDWWRLVVAIQNNATGNTILRTRVLPAANTDGSSVQNAAATGSLIVDYPQVELNARFASSPIETGATAVTRAADNVTSPITTPLPAEFSVVVEATTAPGTSGDFQRLFQYHDGSANNRLEVRRLGGGALGIFSAVGGTTTINTIATDIIPASSPVKTALAVTATGVRASVDGRPVQNFVGDVATAAFTNREAGRQLTGAGYWGGWIKDFTEIPRALSDAELVQEGMRAGAPSGPYENPIVDLFIRLGGTGTAIDPLAGQNAYANIAGSTQAGTGGQVARIDAIAGVAASFTNSTATQQPILRTGGLEFDGADDRLLAPDIPELRFGTTDFTLGFWCRPDTVTGQHGIFSKRGTGASGTNPGWGLRQNGGHLLLEFDHPTMSIGGLNPVVALNAFTAGAAMYGVVHVDRAAATATARINGVGQSPVPLDIGDISSSSFLTIGNEPSNNFKFDGPIGRLLAIDKLLSPEDTALVEQWLQGGGA